MRSSRSVFPPQDNWAPIQVWKSRVKPGSPAERPCCHWHQEQRLPDWEQEAEASRPRPRWGRERPSVDLEIQKGVSQMVSEKRKGTLAA